MRDRGVSDIVGFVLVFAIIVATVGVVYATGMSGLQNVRDAERVDNAERAFDVLADNVDDITQRNAPGRATEIKLADARLYLGEPITVNVTGEQVNGNGAFAFEQEIQPIVYEAGTETEIVYVNGAVIRQNGRHGVMKEPPGILMRDSATMLPIVQTRSQATQSVAGSTTVLVRAEASATDVVVASETGRWNVRVNVTSTRADVWREYFENQGISCDLISRDTVSCEFETERVYLTLFRINVRIKS